MSHLGSVSKAIKCFHFDTPSFLISTERQGSVIILGNLIYQANTCRRMLSPPVFKPAYVYNSLSRFISRSKRFHPFDYAFLSVRLLQSSAVDCIVRYSRPYSPLQWTVQSAVGDYNNLPFKSPWLTVCNGLLFPLFVLCYKEIKELIYQAIDEKDSLISRIVQIWIIFVSSKNGYMNVEFEKEHLARLYEKGKPMTRSIVSNLKQSMVIKENSCFVLKTALGMIL